MNREQAQSLADAKWRDCSSTDDREHVYGFAERDGSEYQVGSRRFSGDQVHGFGDSWQQACERAGLVEGGTMNPTCATCRFYDEKWPKAEYGFCRRNAPRPNTGPTNEPNAEWPTVSDDDWCGEHQVKQLGPFNAQGPAKAASTAGLLVPIDPNAPEAVTP